MIIKIAIGLLVGLTMGAWAVQRMTMYNQALNTTATSGTQITCTAGGTQVFSDTVPSGYMFTGTVGYQGVLTVSN